ncbi:hypothetical protein OG21DRAFT_1569131 [Imleria badia]|nr:hypothetical protein OG21DRAFT_1569131 [Imleria badia]
MPPIPTNLATICCFLATLSSSTSTISLGESTWVGCGRESGFTGAVPRISYPPDALCAWHPHRRSGYQTSSRPSKGTTSDDDETEVSFIPRKAAWWTPRYSSIAVTDHLVLFYPFAFMIIILTCAKHTLNCEGPASLTLHASYNISKPALSGSRGDSFSWHLAERPVCMSWPGPTQAATGILLTGMVIRLDSNLESAIAGVLDTLEGIE